MTNLELTNREYDLIGYAIIILRQDQENRKYKEFTNEEIDGVQNKLVKINPYPPLTEEEKIKVREKMTKYSV